MDGRQSLMDAMLDAAISHRLPQTSKSGQSPQAEFVVHPEIFEELRRQARRQHSPWLYPTLRGMEFLDFPVRVDQRQENWILCEAKR